MTPQKNTFNGILNVYKEQGYTSHDVVAKLRGILKQKKIGHTGTLDPAAEGVLPVCLGKATKVCELLTDKDKTYQAVLHLGVVTDTQDMTGEILEQKDAAVSEAEVREAILGFVGEYAQVPPMYSALKVNGKKLCDLAREGKTVERKARKIKILEIKIDQIALPFVTMTVTCSKGTYIRTLCHDIGEKLGCGGCMESLLRTRVSSFTLKDSLKLPEIEKLQESGKIEQILMPVDAVFMQYPCVSILEEQEKILRNGNPFRVREIQNLLPEEQNVDELEKDRIRVYDTGGQFCAIYEYREEKGMFFPVKMFL